jgi:hypothetical protein
MGHHCRTHPGYGVYHHTFYSYFDECCQHYRPETYAATDITANTNGISYGGTNNAPNANTHVIAIAIAFTVTHSDSFANTIALANYHTRVDG